MMAKIPVVRSLAKGRRTNEDVGRARKSRLSAGKAWENLASNVILIQGPGANIIVDTGANPVDAREGKAALGAAGRAPCCALSLVAARSVSSPQARRHRAALGTTGVSLVGVTYLSVG
jgi:hypothetical protein